MAQYYMHYNGKHIFQFVVGRTPDGIIDTARRGEAGLKALCGFNWYPHVDHGPFSRICQTCKEIRYQIEHGVYDHPAGINAEPAEGNEDIDVYTEAQKELANVNRLNLELIGAKRNYHHTLTQVEASRTLCDDILTELISAQGEYRKRMDAINITVSDVEEGSKNK